MRQIVPIFCIIAFSLFVHQGFAQSCHYALLKSTGDVSYHNTYKGRLLFSFNESYVPTEEVEFRIQSGKGEVLLDHFRQKIQKNQSGGCFLDLRGVSGFEDGAFYTLSLRMPTGPKYGLEFKFNAYANDAEAKPDIVFDKLSGTCGYSDGFLANFYAEIKHNGSASYYLEWYVSDHPIGNDPNSWPPPAKTEYTRSAQKTMLSNGREVDSYSRFSISQTPDYYVMLRVFDGCGMEARIKSQVICGIPTSAGGAEWQFNFNVTAPGSTSGTTY